MGLNLDLLEILTGLSSLIDLFGETFPTKLHEISIREAWLQIRKIVN